MADEELLQRIVSDPQICGGQPCIRGTRIILSVKSRLGSRKLLIVNELRHGRSAVGVVIVSLLSFPLAETIPVEAIS